MPVKSESMAGGRGDDEQRVAASGSGLCLLHQFEIFLESTGWLD